MVINTLEDQESFLIKLHIRWAKKGISAFCVARCMVRKQQIPKLQICYFVAINHFFFL